MNQSIVFLENLEKTMNEASQEANQQLERKMIDRADIYTKVRNICKISFNQLTTQINLEIANFTGLMEHYQGVENKLDVRGRNAYEKKTMSQIKELNLEEYKNELVKLYDMNDDKDKKYYELTVKNFEHRLFEAKTAYDCRKNLEVLKNCKNQFNSVPLYSWIENHEEIKKAQQLLEKQTEQFGNELVEKIKACIQSPIQGMTIGYLRVENENLVKNWIYKEQLTQVLDKYYENTDLKVPYKDHFNDYLIIHSQNQKNDLALTLIAFSTLVRSEKEAIHIYYDMPDSLFESSCYQNCEKVTINDDFINKVREELQQYPSQKIAIFVGTNQNLTPNFEKIIQEKPDTIQIVICQNQDVHKACYKDFIRLDCQQNYYKIHDRYRLYFNRINESKLKDIQPIQIQRTYSFLKDYQEHLNGNAYLVGQNQELSFDDNFVIVSKDKQKRTLFLAQMVLQRLSDQFIHYIYYEDYDDHPLRTIVDQNSFEEINPDMIDAIINDLYNKNTLAIFANPSEELLGYVMTLLDDGHVLTTSETVIDGYKNLNLDENVIQEYDQTQSIQFECLSDDELNQILEEIKK